MIIIDDNLNKNLLPRLNIYQNHKSKLQINNLIPSITGFANMNYK